MKNYKKILQHPTAIMNNFCKFKKPYLRFTVKSLRDYVERCQQVTPTMANNGERLSLLERPRKFKCLNAISINIIAKVSPFVCTVNYNFKKLWILTRGVNKLTEEPRM